MMAPLLPISPPHARASQHTRIDTKCDEPDDTGDGEGGAAPPNTPAPRAVGMVAATLAMPEIALAMATALEGSACGGDGDGCGWGEGCSPGY